MSPAGSAAPSRRGAGGGRAAVTALVVVGVAVGMLLLVRSRPEVESFDPRSGASDGATGAVLLLQQLGASVDITAAAPEPGDADRVLVIADRLDARQRADVLAFVRAGGVAVVADPASTLHGGGQPDDGATRIDGAVPSDLFGQGYQLPAVDEANVTRGECTVAALGTLRGIFSPNGLLFPVDGTQDHCFGDAASAFVIVRTVGEGVVVGLGDNNVVTNGYLRYADNAGLVASLLAPAPGARVRIMIGTETKPSLTDIGRGDEGLVDLVRPGVWMALAQLALAFVVFCVARGVRPGRAVREPLPVPIAGNELVVATGNLMQRAQHHERAAWLIRSELYRQLVAHFGAPPDISIDGLAALVAGRAGIDPDELRAVLGGGLGDGTRPGDELVRLSDRIDDLRRRTIEPTASPPTDKDLAST